MPIRAEPQGWYTSVQRRRSEVEKKLVDLAEKSQDSYSAGSVCCNEVAVARRGKLAGRRLMRLLLGICAVFVVSSMVATGQNGFPPEVYAPLPVPQRAGELIGFSSNGPDGSQLITLVDASQRVMTVYHVDSQTGQITLRSVRRLTFDFAIEEYNAQPPLPADIRQMLGRRPPG